MWKNLIEKRKLRNQKVDEARAGFSSWLDISQSTGWKIYEERLNQKIDNIKKNIENNLTLTGEDLKRLQLALQVYNEVKRIPRELQDRAKGGIDGTRET